MPANKPSIIGLDGVSRPWDEVFPGYVPGCTQDSRYGYIVRRTTFGGGPHSDVQLFDKYSEAVDTAVRVRNEQGANGHAVIDSLYRFDGRIVRVAG
jgi:hypothetical protein